MKKQNHIARSIASLLLVIIVSQHFCSAMCAFGSVGFFVKNESINNHCKKTCCNKTTNIDEKKHDSQDMHFAFFNTTGQFAPEKTLDAFKVWDNFVAGVSPKFYDIPVSQNKSVLAYNGFHPPPSKTDIRIFIQSFQI